MSNAAKNKGKAGERWVADHLGKIFGLNFQRVPNSGAFTGGFNAYRKATMTATQALLANGDIIVPDELAHLSFEVKTYKDFSFSGLFSNNKQLDGWVSQAAACGKLWFLIFKINHAGAYVVFDGAHLNSFSLQVPGNFLRYNRYVVCSIDNFFEHNKAFLLSDAAKSLQSSNEQASLSATT